MPIWMLCLKCKNNFREKYIVSGIQQDPDTREWENMPGTSPCCRADIELDKNKDNKGTLSEIVEKLK